MFGTKRLAKRSIVGSQVCVPWHEDNLYYPGAIQSTAEWPNGEVVYTVQLTEQRVSKVYQAKEIIGPGFQGMGDVILEPGQKVFITRNSRETTGVVLRYDEEEGEVTIDIGTNNDDPVLISQKASEVRLLESRRSRRLQDNDTDYSRMADLHLEPKRRTVSHSIDVPLSKIGRRRHYSEASSSPDGLDDSEIMDETEAALVLTSLSGAASPGADSSMGSSGIWGMQSTSPSPPNLSASAPTRVGPWDEGIVVEEQQHMDENSRKRRASRTVYKCLWPMCTMLFNTPQGIKMHIQQDHTKGQVDLDVSDVEEDLYYNEIEVSVDTVTQSLANMYTSAPKTDTERTLPSDHDYQKKTMPVNIPLHDHMGYFQAKQSGSLPATFPRNWPGAFSNGAKMAKVSRPSSSLSGGFAKGSPMHKRTRSDVKKCRKIYGMDNRDMWCTQCKWKKACSRFLD